MGRVGVSAILWSVQGRVTVKTGGKVAPLIRSGNGRGCSGASSRYTLIRWSRYRRMDCHRAEVTHRPCIHDRLQGNRLIAIPLGKERESRAGSLPLNKYCTRSLRTRTGSGSAHLPQPWIIDELLCMRRICVIIGRKAGRSTERLVEAGSRHFRLMLSRRRLVDRLAKDGVGSRVLVLSSGFVEWVSGFPSRRWSPCLTDVDVPKDATGEGVSLSCSSTAGPLCSSLLFLFESLLICRISLLLFPCLLLLCFPSRTSDLLSQTLLFESLLFRRNFSLCKSALSSSNMTYRSDLILLDLLLQPYPVLQLNLLHHLPNISLRLLLLPRILFIGLKLPPALILRLSSLFLFKLELRNQSAGLWVHSIKVHIEAESRFLVRPRRSDQCSPSRHRRL